MTWRVCPHCGAKFLKVEYNGKCPHCKETISEKVSR